MVITIAVAKSPCTEKFGMADHKLLMGGGLFPVMSASIPAGSAWPFLT
jgi:hypothetical protein